jgi:hypothetical protein
METLVAEAFERNTTPTEGVGGRFLHLVASLRPGSQELKDEFLVRGRLHDGLGHCSSTSTFTFHPKFFLQEIAKGVECTASAIA